MKEVLDEAGVPTARFGVVRPTPVGGRGLPAHPARAVGGQDRRPGRGQGRAGHRVVGRGRGRRRGQALRGRLRRRRPTGGDRGGPGRSGVLAAGPLRRHTGSVPLAPAQDFKRVGDGDGGPNTGGMGAYSPVPAVDDAWSSAAVDDAVAAARRRRCARRGIDYRGVLYAGLMLTADGPKVLEFNVRFGDPETQVVLPRLDGDLAALLAEAAAGSLRTVPRFPARRRLRGDGGGGLPRGPTHRGRHRRAVDAGIGDVDGVTVFHAGTAPAPAGSAGPDPWSPRAAGCSGSPEPAGRSSRPEPVPTGGGGHLLAGCPGPHRHRREAGGLRRPRVRHPRPRYAGTGRHPGPGHLR